MSARDRAAFVLATWFGCGYVPFAPGTAGTLGALPLYFGLRAHGTVAVVAGAIAITAIGVWAAGTVARRTATKDPQIVVIDEVAGTLWTLSVAPKTTLGVVVGVACFRIFDQMKPWPANRAERDLPGGLGIVLDDVAAAAWAAGALALLRWRGWL